MNIKIQSIRFNADKKLLSFIESKTAKLLQFHDGIIGAEVFLRLENVGDNENKIVEIRLDIPGTSVFSKRQSNTFEEATDNAVEALRKQLLKYKEKIRKV